MVDWRGLQLFVLKRTGIFSGLNAVCVCCANVTLWGSATGGMCPLTNMGKKWILEVNFYPFTFIFFLLAKYTVFINAYLMA